MTGLTLNQGATGVVKFGLAGRSIGEQRLKFPPDIDQRLRDPVGLQRRSNPERPRAAAGVEVAPDPVGEPLLLPQAGIEPRGELAAQDLVPEQKRVVVGMPPLDAPMSQSYNGLRCPGPVDHDQTGPRQPARGREFLLALVRG